MLQIQQFYNELLKTGRVQKKNQPELFHSRLEKFLKNTRENRMFGEWHDGGRLLEE